VSTCSQETLRNLVKVGNSAAKAAEKRTSEWPLPSAPDGEWKGVTVMSSLPQRGLGAIIVSRSKWLRARRSLARVLGPGGRASSFCRSAEDQSGSRSRTHW
jgi:hypothetical protein